MGSPGGSSILGASANLFNSVVGVGIIMLPEAIYTSGLYLGIIIALVVFGFSCYTSLLMVETAEKDGDIDSYGVLCEKSMGNFGFYSLTVMNSLMMLGAMSIYCILFKMLLGDLCSDILGQDFDYSREAMVLAAVLIMLPLSLLKSMSKLEWSSGLSTLAVFVIILIVAIRAPAYHEQMTTMDKPKMEKIAGGLDKEKAKWLCDMALSDTRDPYKDAQAWAMTRVNSVVYTPFFNSLKAEKGACTTGPTLEIIGNQEAVDFLGKADGTLRTSLEKAFAETEYHKWSINSVDAAKLDTPYSFHQFGKLGSLKTLGTFTSAFIMQQCVFSIYLSLKNPTKRNLLSLLSVAMVTVLVCINSLMAFIGFWNSEYHTHVRRCVRYYEGSFLVPEPFTRLGHQHRACPADFDNRTDLSDANVLRTQKCDSHR
eukprot:731125_1